MILNLQQFDFVIGSCGVCDYWHNAIPQPQRGAPVDRPLPVNILEIITKCNRTARAPFRPLSKLRRAFAYVHDVQRNYYKQEIELSDF